MRENEERQAYNQITVKTRRKIGSTVANVRVHGGGVVAPDDQVLNVEANGTPTDLAGKHVPGPIVNKDDYGITHVVADAHCTDLNKIAFRTGNTPIVVQASHGVDVRDGEPAEFLQQHRVGVGGIADNED